MSVPRSAVGMLAELERREAQKRGVLSELFGRQLALHFDPAPYRAAHAGRRGGKSEFIPRSSAVTVLDAGAGESALLGAETQKKAIALHWASIAWLKARRGLPLVPNMQLGQWMTPWGSYIQFWGLNDRNAVDLLRGFKGKGAIFDEVATYAPHLKYLTQDVLKPVLADTGGTLTLCGTPSLTRAGYWFDICKTQRLGRWSVHHWTLLDNPKFPRDARAVLAAALADLGGDEQNATFRREWLGEFVDDPENQVYQYLSGRNDVAALPSHYDLRRWIHVVAVDFGVNDDCAWSVFAMHPHERRVYVVLSRKQARLTTDEAAEITADLCGAYEPIKLIGDTGGLGKAYALEWDRRYAGRTAAELRREHRGQSLGDAVPSMYAMPGMVCAEKSEKRAGIDFANTELRSGRVLFVEGACDPLTAELASLPWKDGSRLVEHPAYPNHCADTFLYGLRELRPYLNEAPEPRLDPSVNSPSYDAWQIEQEVRALRGEPEDSY